MDFDFGKCMMRKFILFIFVFSFQFFPVHGQDTLATVTAEKGDGIYSLLRKHGVNPYEYYHEFVDINLDNLRDSVHLYEGRTYAIPKVPLDTIPVVDSIQRQAKEVKEVEAKTYDIFGEKHKTVLSKSERLKGAIYYLVSGHGGPDPGAMAVYAGKSISEDEYAYDITLRLAKELLGHGASVYIIIRDENDGIREERILEMDRDEVAYPDKVIPLNQRDRLQQRVDIVNDLYKQNKGAYQRLIVTHVDSRSVGQNIDVFFYHHEKSQNGKRLAESIHKTFEAKYKQYQPNRTYSGTFEDRTSLFLVKKTHPAMTFIEIGNIRNEKDQRRILDPDNRQALAKWISEGVILDYEER
ncbi:MULTISPECIES: N-acetylmuramoyl-L-alanine amidase family protein [Maribacter]|uniref:N-acetylmuramoyl-L-alanine amidase n=1 Tax=Maribacter flavus TaxID=1658664 RepID=A0ABU7IGF5_9FLAO|nr:MULTISPECIES: N-acetylmuramoyl-L-alanine amidase [Maribacter]MDC6405399.1 N-acetylmuramoyl-L-alanine amidase [Maribacter sp. PR66]MEE1971793.1 N-acetylmuramoyl-L-alanine amidase [Maribacter flavus]